MSKVKISTSKGDMIAELYDNETPITTDNFKSLISKKFYDGLNFHRVIPNFVIQGGCPNGMGNGGPGYNIDCEVTAPKQFHDKVCYQWLMLDVTQVVLSSSSVTIDKEHNTLTETILVLVKSWKVLM
jgi:cyclophilin family peptidyl-prolyl cis-trans isomerase